MYKRYEGSKMRQIQVADMDSFLFLGEQNINAKRVNESEPVAHFLKEGIFQKLL